MHKAGGQQGPLADLSPFHQEINELLSSSSTLRGALCNISIGEKLRLLYP
jgi:hypothetical protein